MEKRVQFRNIFGTETFTDGLVPKVCREREGINSKFQRQLHEYGAGERFNGSKFQRETRLKGIISRLITKTTRYIAKFLAITHYTTIDFAL